MVEYGQSVGQAGQVAHGASPTTSSPTDVGAAFVANLTDALDHASATLGVSPAILVVAGLAALLVIGWFVFAR